MNVKKVNIHQIFFDKFFFTKDMAALWLDANEIKSVELGDNDGLLWAELRPAADFKLNAFGEGKDFQFVMAGQGVAFTVGELQDDVKANIVPDTKEFKKTHRMVKVDEEKRLVTGPVLVPWQVDLQGDFEFPEDIEKSAHGFMAEARNIGVMHKFFGGKGDPVESWLIREPMWVDRGDHFKIYPVGTWMLTVHVTDDKAWEDVRNGKLTGFSIGFRGTREAVA